MTAGIIFFLMLALGAIAAALGMLLSRNTIYAAVFLVLNFSLVAVLYLTLAAPFIALVQITVYAGAIMVLFLFVIMLLGAEQMKLKETPIPWQPPLAIALGLVLLVEGIYVIFFRSNTGAMLPAPAAGFGSPAQVGLELYTRYLLPFEITSVLLLVAMIGAIVLTRAGKIRPTPPPRELIQRHKDRVIELEREAER